MTEPHPAADQIDEYPVADPRENTELLQLSFDNPCAVRKCCPKLRVSYDVKVTRYVIISLLLNVFIYAYYKNIKFIFISLRDIIL
ncbi:unnamed protein product [Trichobilharzia regenti]|nr:unnamed protein product [Trichobilharzia regenti]